MRNEHKLQTLHGEEMIKEEERPISLKRQRPKSFSYLFIPFVSFVELISYLYYWSENGNVAKPERFPTESLFIYRPDKRLQLWRFVSYVLVHPGWYHLVCNLLIQIIVGVPLEMVHGSGRTAIVYFSGVLAGSLSITLLKRDVYLAGASGGVYALLTAHVAHTLMNYSYVQGRLFRTAAIMTILLADVTCCIWNYFFIADTASQYTSYVAHYAAAFCGLITGFLVLKKFEGNFSALLIPWFCSSLCIAIISTSIICNNFLRY